MKTEKMLKANIEKNDKILAGNKMREKLKISIIVPMYNSFHMMERNLQVLERQKAIDIELILVDDCSKDDSYDKAVQYAKTSKLCIKVVRNAKNGGPGVSRNHGIHLATGDYITFVDSDDYFSVSFADVLVPILNQGVDCVIFDYINVNEDGSHLSNGKTMEIPFEEGIVDNKMAFVFAHGSTWGKVYKRSLINENYVQFGEFFRGEDMPFTKHALAVSNTIYYTNAQLYHYVQMPTSLMHNSNLTDEKNCQRAFSLLEERVDGEKWKDELQAIKLREVLNNTVLIKIGKKENSKQIRAYIQKNYSKLFLKNIYYKLYPKHVKLISVLSYYQQVFLLSFLLKIKKYLKNRM